MKIKLNPQIARAKIAAQAPLALAEGGNILLSAARERCPVQTGRLRESGSVQLSGKQARVAFSAPYAAVVHERANKFLENPMNENGVQEKMLSAFVRRMAL